MTTRRRPVHSRRRCAHNLDLIEHPDNTSGAISPLPKLQRLSADAGHRQPRLPLVAVHVLRGTLLLAHPVGRGLRGRARVAGRAGLPPVHVQRERSQRHAREAARDLRRDHPPRAERQAHRPAAHPQEGAIAPSTSKLRRPGSWRCGSASTRSPRTRCGCRKRATPRTTVRQNLATAGKRASTPKSTG